MQHTRQPYKVLKPVVLEHAPYKEDEIVHLYPKQATYLVTGGFLTPNKTTKSTKTSIAKG